ncbi:MAG: RNA polymerase sigma factor [Holophagales bacterium]|nr:RNA polymerase sigma factor [Holophagales bacterium]
MAEPIPFDREKLALALERWQRREEPEESFRQIVESCYGRLFGFFRRRGEGEESAHDLTQETFVRIHTHLNSFRRDSSFETWMFTIAANVWRRSHRDRHTLKRGGEAQPRSLEEGFREPATDGGGPLEQAIRRQRIEHLRSALEELPPQMRAVLKLHLYQDRSRPEIAEALGISVDTVKTHLLQGRRRLAAALTDSGSDAPGSARRAASEAPSEVRP